MEEATIMVARMEERAAMAARRRRISMGTPTTEITPTVFTMAVMVEAMEEEVVPFTELANELWDLCHPSINAKVSLNELRRCDLGYNLVSALTNVRKYIAWEGLSCEKAAGRASNLRDTRDWDLFADSEYRRLVETEDGGEPQAAATGEGDADETAADDDTDTAEQSV